MTMFGFLILFGWAKLEKYIIEIKANKKNVFFIDVENWKSILNN